MWQKLIIDGSMDDKSLQWYIRILGTVVPKLFYNFEIMSKLKVLKCLSVVHT